MRSSQHAEFVKPLKFHTFRETLKNILVLFKKCDFYLRQLAFLLLYNTLNLLSPSIPLVFNHLLVT